MPATFHPGPNFAGYAPVQLTTGPITPGQFYPPLTIYWPYPSPPVSPTSYYTRTIPPPSALTPQQPQQQMIPPDCIAIPPMGVPMPPPVATVDARMMGDGMPPPDPDKIRQSFAPNQYVELII